MARGRDHVVAVEMTLGEWEHVEMALREHVERWAERGHWCRKVHEKVLRQVEWLDGAGKIEAEA